MHRSAWIGAAAVLVVTAALLLYQNVEQRTHHERELSEMRAQSEATRATLAEQVSSQQEKLEQAQRALSDEREARARASDPASLLMAEDLAVVSAMRVAIAEAFATTGKMPATNTDAGLLAPERYRGKTLKSAALMPDGRIALVFDAQSGVDGGRILFVPDTSHADAMGIRWNCETPDYPQIKRALPGCEFKPAVAVSGPPETVLQAPPSAH